MLILTGMMTFGIALHNYLTLTNAVSIGATNSVFQCYKPCQGLRGNANRFVKP